MSAHPHQLRNVYIQFILNDFLSNLDYNIIHLLPFNNNAYMVSAHVRNGARIQMLTGKDLLKWNIEREAQRLHLHNLKKLKIIFK